jgi:serine protease inhibitor ecotin
MDFAEEDENAESEDFEAICNLAVGTILRLNMTETPRTTKEQGKIMNKLTDGNYMLHPDFMNRLNAPISTVRQCGDWKMMNKTINIYIEQEDGELRYNLIAPKKESK